tara:strand:+ start:4205 stop:4471 length:267 start_codon:yes stop_codon:yes gene_type:complete
MFKYLFILLIIGIFLYLVYNRKIETFENNILIQNKKMPQQLDLLTYSTFSPDCCPSVYSSSTGCLCDNNNEFSAITTRGGNRSNCDRR